MVRNSPRSQPSFDEDVVLLNQPYRSRELRPSCEAIERISESRNQGKWGILGQIAGRVGDEQEWIMAVYTAASLLAKSPDQAAQVEVRSLLMSIPYRPNAQWVLINGLVESVDLGLPHAQGSVNLLRALTSCSTTSRFVREMAIHGLAAINYADGRWPFPNQEISSYLRLQESYVVGVVPFLSPATRLTKDAVKSGSLNVLNLLWTVAESENYPVQTRLAILRAFNDVLKDKADLKNLAKRLSSVPGQHREISAFCVSILRS